MKTNLFRCVSCFMLIVAIAGFAPTAYGTLVGHWNLDEGSGSSAADGSGSGNNGTLLGGSLPTWVAGASGQSGDYSLDFGAGDDGPGNPPTGTRVQVPNSASLQITGDQTYSFWMFANDLTKRVNPLNKAYGGEGTVTLENGSGQLSYFYGTAGNDNNPYQQHTSAPVTPGVWQLVTHTRDLGGPNTQAWYINGVLSTTVGATYDPAVAGTQALIIGNGYEGSFNGRVDDVAIWNSSLTPTFVRALYSLATQPGLYYDQGSADDLFEAFAATSSVGVEGHIWAYKSGLVGTPGTVVSLGIDSYGQAQFYVILDALGNGMQTTSVPEPSTAALLGLGIIGMSVKVQRRRRAACPSV